MSELNCMNCCIGAFKYDLCDCDGDFCKKYKRIGNADDFIKAVIADRPSGEWIDRSDGGRILNPWWETYECSKCGQYGTRIWNFCPNCGSKMRGEHDD